MKGSICCDRAFRDDTMVYGNSYQRDSENDVSLQNQYLLGLMPQVDKLKINPKERVAKLDRSKEIASPYITVQLKDNKQLKIKVAELGREKLLTKVLFQGKELDKPFIQVKKTS